MIVQLCLFFSLYTYKTCLPFLVIKDSFTLEIPTLIFVKPTVHLLLAPLILNFITLCCFLQLLAEETILR